MPLSKPRRSRHCAVILALLSVIWTLGACAKRSEPASDSAGSDGARPSAAAAPKTSPATSTASLPSGRRVIRKAELTLEVDSPPDANRKARHIAERHGGYVASASSRTRRDQAAADSVSLTLRVPAPALTSVLDELRRLGTGTGTEQLGAEDVSEEFVDLEARLANQRALEQQFLGILERARSVEEALAVQRELAAVRTEIDRMEGRRRFLEREVDLATIALTFEAAEPLVTASLGDFERALRDACSNAIRVGAAIVTGSLRAAGALLPVAVLVGLPLALAIRWFTRRRRTAPVVATS